jgi:hypothetical protein
MVVHELSHLRAMDHVSGFGTQGGARRNSCLSAQRRQRAAVGCGFFVFERKQALKIAIENN